MHLKPWASFWTTDGRSHLYGSPPPAFVEPETTAAHHSTRPSIATTGRRSRGRRSSILQTSKGNLASRSDLAEDLDKLFEAYNDTHTRADIIVLLPPAIRSLIKQAKMAPRSNLPDALNLHFANCDSERFYKSLKAFAKEFSLAIASPVLQQALPERRHGTARRFRWTPRDVNCAYDLLRQQQADANIEQTKLHEETADTRTARGDEVNSDAEKPRNQDPPSRDSITGLSLASPEDSSSVFEPNERETEPPPWQTDDPFALGFIVASLTPDTNATLDDRDSNGGGLGSGNDFGGDNDFANDSATDGTKWAAIVSPTNEPKPFHRVLQGQRVIAPFHVPESHHWLLLVASPDAPGLDIFDPAQSMST
ncbi:hypothetical protein ColTof4_14404 [Colletotrichum tofieldiae]|nr:hypothetical protein ColTof3_14876 [Colletotrichum tofieldiae]GKT81981.1 hypothetical protein ColTof4_14404 [Colletotrichum tofieldiae]